LAQNQKRFRMLTVIDEFTRRCLAMVGTPAKGRADVQLV
jgi:hypothetical protein